MFASSNIRDPSLGPIGPITYGLGRKPSPPPCSCIECSRQFRKEAEQYTWIHAYNDGIDNNQADAICKSLVASINSDVAFLKHQMARRGLGISQRWKKKTVKNRGVLLKTIDPEMYDRKWHEGHISYEARHNNWLVEARKDQAIHLLPYMSVENLTEDPSRLIKLLRLRTEYSPASLAIADNRRLTFGWTTGILETTFNGSAVAMYGSQYGTLVPWVQEEAHRGDSIGFPRGQLILKAQSHLLSVLRRVAEVLVDDLPEDSEFISPSTFNLGIIPSAAANTVYVDEPFSNSLAFDLQKLAEISSSQQKAAKDHLFLLQTDAAYMRRYVELINASGYANKLPEGVSIMMTAQDLDFDVWTVRHWTWISQEIIELEKVKCRFADQTNHGQAIPPQFNKKLASFETLILHLLDMQSRHIQCMLPYRPGFQESYNFSHSTIDGVVHITHSSKSRREDPLEQAIVNAEVFVQDPLQWAILSLTTDLDAPGVLDKFRLLEFLDQYLNKASANERARIDEVVLRKISDLAAFNELLAIIRSHQPRAEQISLTTHRTTDIDDLSLAWRFMSKTMVNTELNNDGKSFTTERSLQEIPLPYSSIGRLLKLFMEQEPSGDKSDRRWITKDIAERRALRSLWNGLRYGDQNRLKEAGVSSVDMKDDLKLIGYDNDPGFLAVLDAERKEFLDSRKSTSFMPKENKRPVRLPTVGKDAGKVTHTQGIIEPVSTCTSKQSRPHLNDTVVADVEMQTEWGITPTATKPTAAMKTKNKTRGEASIDQMLDDLVISTNNIESQRLGKVLVKKSAYEVLCSLFSSSKKSTSIAWDKFVDAMSKVGFVARRSGGSAVTFEPSSESRWFGQGSIVFHRPHPDSAIDPVMLKAIGKRMKKWFGWESGTFQTEK